MRTRLADLLWVVVAPVVIVLAFVLGGVIHLCEDDGWEA